MPVLALLRHAKAAQAAAGQRDFDRPLTERGQEDSARMARVVARLAPALALVSSAARTRETWEIVARGLAKAPDLSTEDGLYLCSVDALAARLQEIPDEISSAVVVGHNPCLHELALRLAALSPSATIDILRIKFPTAALAELEIDGSWADLAPSRTRLIRFTTPAAPD